MGAPPKAPPPIIAPTNTTTTKQLPAFAQPAAESLLSRATTLSEAPLQPALPGAEQRLQGFSPEQEAAFGQLTQRGLFGNPLTNAAQGATFNQLTTDPTQNPLVDKLVGTAQGDIVDQFNLNVAPSLAARNKASGSFGNTGLQELESAQRFGLARALGDVENQIRLPAFESQSARQLQAAQLAPGLDAGNIQNISGLLGVGEQRQGFAQAGKDIEFANLLQQREEPIQQLDILARALGAATGGGNLGTSTQQTQNLLQRPTPENQTLGALGTGAGILGTLALGAALFASDRSLKENIAEIDDPLDTILALKGVEFDYIEPETIGETEGRKKGFIAQDVKEVIPEWVIDVEGKKYMNTRGFEALAVEAIRELRKEKDAQIADLRTEIEEMRGD